MSAVSPATARALSGRMTCAHDGFHAIRTAYDQRRGVLVFHWTCERCGARLREAAREPYRPAFDPDGHRRLAQAP